MQWVGAPIDGHFLYKKYSIQNKNNHPLSFGENTKSFIKNMKFTKFHNEQVIKKIKSFYQSGAWFNRQNLHIGKPILSKEETKKLLEINNNKKIAVIFSHIFYDATLFYGKSLFTDYSTWLLETIKLAIENENLNWFIKVHPVNIWRSKMDNKPIEQLEEELVRREIGKLPKHIKIIKADSPINTFSLFELIDYGLTVRGTIGMELPCWGVPVITAGTGRYDKNGFTIDPANIEEFRQILKNLHDLEKLNPKEIESARKYAWAVMFLKQVRIKSLILYYKKKKMFTNEIEYNTSINKEFSKNKEFFSDIKKVADWIDSNNQEDLLNY